MFSSKVNNTSLLGISTPLDENNFYSQMLEMRYELAITPSATDSEQLITYKLSRPFDMAGNLTARSFSPYYKYASIIASRTFSFEGPRY